MTITIPAWIMWALGGVGLLVVLALAAIGIIFIWVIKDWDFKLHY